jgi:autotransporter-associated beta strand protein
VSGTVFVNGISYTAASGSFAIESGTISVGGTTPSISVNTSRTLTINSTLAGSTAWSKAGAGTLILGGANSYDGATTINAGVLNIRNNTALGSSVGGTTIASGAALQLQGNITITGEALSLAGGGISNDGALRNISGNNTWTGDITTQANNTRIQADAGSLLTIGGNISTAGFTAILQGNGTTNITGGISGSLGGVTLSAAGSGNPIVSLSGNNSYTGVTTINAGTLSIGTIANGNSNSNIGASATTASNLVLGGGTLQYTGSGNSTDRNFTLRVRH